MGDMSINLINVTHNTVNSYVNLSFFFLSINKPTRVSTSVMLIDHIWVNDTSIVSKCGILPADVSDHFAPFIKCSVQADSTTNREFKD